MTDLNANALEQDADDDADVVDSWMLFLRDASFLGHCSAASASALHRVLGARVHENLGAKVYGRNKPGI